MNRYLTVRIYKSSVRYLNVFLHRIIFNCKSLKKKIYNYIEIFVCLCLILVLVRFTKARFTPTRPIPRGPVVTFLCEILHSRPCSTGGRIYSVPVLPSSKARFGARPTTMQRQYGCPNGQLYCTR